MRSAALVLAPAAGADLSVGVADDHAEGRRPQIAETLLRHDEGRRARRRTGSRSSGTRRGRRRSSTATRSPTPSTSPRPTASASRSPSIPTALARSPSRRTGRETSPPCPPSSRGTFPQVKDFIIGNEPNKARFWQPQFNPNGTAAACAAYEPLLAASYDALKAVDRNIIVIGVGLGAARDGQSARRGQPLDLAGALHPRHGPRVPREQAEAADHGRAQLPPAPERRHGQARDGLLLAERAASRTSRGSSRPSGTRSTARRQPTFEEAGHASRARADAEAAAERGRLAGRHSAEGSRGAYFGKESVVTTDEGNQAAIYGNLIPLLACDPAVKSVLFFNLVDEANLDRWQSGLMRADWTRRPVLRDRQGRDRRRPDALRRAGASRGGTRSSPSASTSASLGGSRPRSDAEQGLELRRRLRGGHALHRRRSSACARPGEGLGRGSLPRSFRSLCARAACARAALKSSGKLVGGWDKVITFRREAPQARVLRLCGPDRRGDEPGAAGDVRRAAVRRASASAKLLTRTPVRTSMANTCSVGSSSSSSWPRSSAGA